MTLRYPSEFYTYRDIEPSIDRAGSEPVLPLERQLQLHLLRGHRAFMADRYADALADYRAAWRTLPRFVDPSFPADADGWEETQLLGVDLIDPLVSASVQILRLRGSAGSAAPILSAIDPPAALRRIARGKSQDALGQHLARCRLLLAGDRSAWAVAGGERGRRAVAPGLQW
jgi:hypothetical protein